VGKRVFLKYALRRIGYSLAVIWVASTAIFVLIHVAPSDPVAYIVGRLTVSGGGFANGQELVAAYRAQFGLDGSLPEQYVAYLGQLAQLNLGYSIPFFPTTVTDLIARALPWTLGLLFTTTIIAFGLGTVLGALMAWRQSSKLGQVVLPMFMLLSAIPYYLLALGLLYVFAYTLHMLPTGGVSNILSNNPSPIDAVLDAANHSILPGLSVVLSAMGFWMISMRSAMVPVLGSDFLLLAEAKGLSERRIFFRYALRNALLPQVTGLAIALGSVLAGQVLVEVVYSYPGLGRLLVDAVSGRDYPTVQGITLILVVTVTLGVLIVDLLYPRIDPRISYEQR
jgi:peptide/nickel transport system permease protein